MGYGDMTDERLQEYSNIILPRFDGSYFSQWKKRIEIFMLGFHMSLWEIIIEEIEVKDVEMLTRRIETLKILYKALEGDVYENVKHLKTPYEVWNKLESIYGDNPRSYESKDETSSLCSTSNDEVSSKDNIKTPIEALKKLEGIEGENHKEEHGRDGSPNHLNTIKEDPCPSNEVNSISTSFYLEHEHDNNVEHVDMSFLDMKREFDRMCLALRDLRNQLEDERLSKLKLVKEIELLKDNKLGKSVEENLDETNVKENLDETLLVKSLRHKLEFSLKQNKVVENELIEALDERDRNRRMIDSANIERSNVLSKNIEMETILSGLVKGYIKLNDVVRKEYEMGKGVTYASFENSSPPPPFIGPYHLKFVPPFPHIPKWDPRRPFYKKRPFNAKNRNKHGSSNQNHAWLYHKRNSHVNQVQRNYQGNNVLHDKCAKHDLCDQHEEHAIYRHNDRPLHKGNSPHAPYKQRYVCTYCKRYGHLEPYCYIRRQDENGDHSVGWRYTNHRGPKRFWVPKGNF